jgi:hypothetical protein
MSELASLESKRVHLMGRAALMEAVSSHATGQCLSPKTSHTRMISNAGQLAQMGGGGLLCWLADHDVC